MSTRCMYVQYLNMMVNSTKLYDAWRSVKAGRSLCTSSSIEDRLFDKNKISSNSRKSDGTSTRLSQCGTYSMGRVTSNQRTAAERERDIACQAARRPFGKQKPTLVLSPVEAAQTQRPDRYHRQHSDGTHDDASKLIPALSRDRGK